MLEERQILFGLHEIEGVGWITIDKIMKHFKDLHTLMKVSTTELNHCLQDSRRAQIIKQKLTVDYILRRWEEYERLNIHVMTFLDEEYPILLGKIANPPWILYCLGKLDYLYKPTIAVVGTRNPTSYGKRTAEALSQELSKNGCCVVSGMARGIDSNAHHGALKETGSTIAVLGTGINVIYPPEHKLLYEEISRRGLIVSEYPLDTKGMPGLFPLRNRIINGLSLGVVVVEAAKGSGSLITTAHATKESRDVFAVPGPISSPKSKGPIDLLKDGAKIVTTADDILVEYKHMLTLIHNKPVNAAITGVKLTEDEQKILDFLSFEPLLFDHILELSEFTFGHLHSLLLSLLLKNKIEQCSGSKYVRVY